jgi:hypothetical protein
MDSKGQKADQAFQSANSRVFISTAILQNIGFAGPKSMFASAWFFRLIS